MGDLEGSPITRVEKVLWVREPATCVAAGVPIATGTGMILFSQLDLQRHVNRSGHLYDPVAKRILVNLLDPSD